MTRKDRLLKTHEWLIGRNSAEVLQLDSGDLFFATQEVPASLRRQTETQARALAKALRLTGLRAFVPGEKDFALGIDFLTQLIQESQATGLAANLERKTKSGWKSWLAPYKVFELRSQARQRHRVAVLGLVGNKITVPKTVRVTDPLVAARKWISQLRKKSDWVVVLTHQGLEEDQKLARAVPGIDFVIGAHSQSFLQTPEIIENSVRKTSIHQSSFRNQYVGLIELVKTPNSQLVALDSSLDTLEPTSKPSPNDELQTLFAKTKQQIAEVNLEEEKKLLQIVSAAEKEGIPKYQTFAKCADCHFKQFDFWRNTPHARAYEVLVKAGQHQNLECLSCHTVGLGDPEGFSRLHQLVEWRKDLQKKPPALETWLSEIRTGDHPRTRTLLQQVNRVHTPVQCENCHQPGRDHPFGLETLTKTVATESCVKCHTPERAPGWYGADKKLDPAVLAQKFKSMACPAGDGE